MTLPDSAARDVGERTKPPDQVPSMQPHARASSVTFSPCRSRGNCSNVLRVPAAGRSDSRGWVGFGPMGGVAPLTGAAGDRARLKPPGGAALFSR
jgi:hypothetical protein